MYNTNRKDLIIKELQSSIDKINDIYNNELKKDFENLRNYWQDDGTNIYLNKSHKIETDINYLVAELENIKSAWMDYDSKTDK